MHTFMESPNSLSFALELVACIGGVFMVAKVINSCIGCFGSSTDEDKVELELGEIEEGVDLNRRKAVDDE